MEGEEEEDGSRAEKNSLLIDIVFQGKKTIVFFDKIT